MKGVIYASIDLTKIDQKRIKEVKLKNQKTAKFYQIAIYIDTDKVDNYGNTATLTEGKFKDEIKDTVYLGNGKTFPSNDTADQENIDISESGLPF